VPSGSVAAMSNLLCNLKLIPNQITAVRFLLVPAIWGLALGGHSEYVGTALIICFASDALDGYLARRLHQCTEFGAKFDSLADNLLIPSALGWLIMFRPVVLQDHVAVSAVAFGTYVCSLAIGWMKFRQFGNLHLYLSKISGVLQYVSIIDTFLGGYYNQWLFYFTVSLFFLSSLETLILRIVSSKVDHNMGSILFVLNIIDRSLIFPIKTVSQAKQPEGVAGPGSVIRKPKDSEFSKFTSHLLRFFKAVYGADFPVPEPPPISFRHPLR
jgi:cardiolipin synthase (CMP-forming)